MKTGFNTEKHMTGWLFCLLFAKNKRYFSNVYFILNHGVIGLWISGLNRNNTTMILFKCFFFLKLSLHAIFINTFYEVLISSLNGIAILKINFILMNIKAWL